MSARRKHTSKPDRSIVVGTDGSPSATTAVRRAAELARVDGARLHIVTAYDPSISGARRKVMNAMPEELAWKASPGQEAEDVAAQAAGIVAGDGVDVEPHAEPGDPATVLVDLAEKVHADLLVVGNKGMHGAGRILNSVPNKVSHRASCDVLIVDTTGKAA
jgi:nucleotide-binding universal stress UspA family protein